MKFPTRNKIKMNLVVLKLKLLKGKKGEKRKKRILLHGQTARDPRAPSHLERQRQEGSVLPSQVCLKSALLILSFSSLHSCLLFLLLGDVRHSVVLTAASEEPF